MLNALLRRGKTFFAMACSLVVAGLAPQSLQAQNPVQLSLLQDQLYPIYNISDFDITGGGGAIDLFNCTITFSGEYKLRLQIISDRYSFPLIEALTSRMSGNRTITYRDFRGINIESFVYRRDQLENLSDAILRTGKLPSGRYDITVQILNPTTNQPIPGAFDTETLIISNPIALDLISPGQNAGMASCPTLFSTLPQFTWNSDADKFTITICEALPTNSSPEDVMQNPPRLRMTLRRNQDFFGTPVFQYPTGGLPLLPGRVYYWQALAFVQAASGEVQLPSEIWCFKIHSNDQAQSALQMQQLINWLASMGLQDLLALFQPGGPLAGFTPTGKVVMNGKTIDLAELLVLLQNGTIKIKAYNVE